MVTAYEVRKAAAETIGVSSRELTSESRSLSRVRARHLVTVVCKDALAMSYPEIAKLLGRKDHTAARSGYQNARRRLEEGAPGWRESLREIHGRLCGG